MSKTMFNPIDFVQNNFKNLSNLRTNVIDPSVTFASWTDRLRLAPGVVIQGNVLIKAGTTIHSNTLIQASPGKLLVLEGNIGHNCVIQAMKRDCILTGKNIHVRDGAFVKDVQLEDMLTVDLGSLSETKEVQANGHALWVGKRAFIKNIVLTSDFEVPPLSRVDHHSHMIGMDIFHHTDCQLAKVVREAAEHVIQENKDTYLNIEELNALRHQGINLLSVKVKIGRKVHIGKGSTIYPGVQIWGNVRIGLDNVFYPNTHIATGGSTSITIGENNHFYPNTKIASLWRDISIGNDCAEIGIGGGAVVFDSEEIGDNVFLVGNPVIGYSALKGNNRIFRSLVLESTLQAGSPDNEIEIKTGSIAHNLTVSETVPENTRVEG